MNIVFGRIGWMTFYSGAQVGDERPVGGGKYNESGMGHEALNFKSEGERLLGYFAPPMAAQHGINAQRIEPTAEGSTVNDTLVIFVSTNPARKEGQVVVGWYRHATVYADYPYRKNAPKKPWFYCAETLKANAVLLPTPNRVYSIPKGKGAFGQSNVLYLYEADGRPKKLPWLQPVLDYIEGYNGPNLVDDSAAERSEEIGREIEVTSEGSQGFQSNPLIRKAVEDYSMKKAKAYFAKAGYEVHDVSRYQPYDLLCEKKGSKLFVEVKGCQGTAAKIVLTKNEVAHHLKASGQSALFVLEDIKVTPKGKKKYVTTGGHARIFLPWKLKEAALEPIHYFLPLS